MKKRKVDLKTALLLEKFKNVLVQEVEVTLASGKKGIKKFDNPVEWKSLLEV